MYTDYLHNELHVGDKVIFIDTDYHEFSHGIIAKLNDNKATIQIIIDDVLCDHVTFKHYHQIIKENVQ